MQARLLAGEDPSVLDPGRRSMIRMDLLDERRRAAMIHDSGGSSCHVATRTFATI